MGGLPVVQKKIKTLTIFLLSWAIMSLARVKKASSTFMLVFALVSKTWSRNQLPTGQKVKDDKSYKRNKTKKTLDKIFNKQYIYIYISFKLNPVSIIIQEWHLWIVLVLLILQDLFDIILLKWCIICMENSRFVRREGPHFLSSLFGHLSPVVHVTFVSEDHLLYVRWCMLKWVIEKFSASSYSQIKLNSLTNVSNTQIMWDPGPQNQS